MVRALTMLRLAPLGFLTAVAVLSGLGLAGAWTVAQGTTPVGVILWMLPSVIVGALFTVYGTALLQGALVGSDVDVEREVLWRRGRVISMVFAIFTVTVSLAAYFYVKDLGTTVRQHRLGEQTSIASLKAQQIDRWLLERWVDTQWLGSALRAAPLWSSELARSDVGLIEVLFAEMLAGGRERVAVRLYSSDGRLIAQGGEPAAPDSATRFVARNTVAGHPGKARVDQWRNLSGALRIDLVLPISAPNGASPPVYLVVRVDPAVELLPQIMTWPVVSETSEIVLVRREGQSAVSLVRPRRASPESLDSIATPLSDTGYVSVQSVLMGSGVREGLDYRGIRVLAASRLVPALDWQVIAKTDVSEALTPLERRAQFVVWLTAGAVLVAAATSYGLWQTDRSSLAELRRRNILERQALGKHYEQMMRHARDFVFLLDDEQRIVDANAAAVAAYGYSIDELRGRHISEVRVERARSRLAADWATMRATGTPFETVHRRKDGTEFPVEVTAGIFEVDGRTFMQAFVRDVTHRKALELEVARQARLHSALRAASSVLLRATAEDELYRGMCNALIDVGGYRLASVGLAQHDAARTVRFVAAAGDDRGYLAQSRVTWDDGPMGRGPTGAAIRTGKVQINEDIATNADFAPWREAALERNLRASIGLPLRVNGTVIGALTIHSGDAGAFDSEEVALLVRFAEDISYGVGNLRRSAS